MATGPLAAGRATASLVDAASPSPELLAQWAVLEAEALEPNPFFASAMLLPAVRHLAGGGEVRLLVVHDGPDLLFLAPVSTRWAPLGLPVPGLVVWVHQHCYLGTPLVSASRADEAWAAVLVGLGSAWRQGWLVLPLTVVDGPVLASLRHVSVGYVLATAPVGNRACYLATEGADPEARTSKSTRRRLRRHRESLGEALGGAVTVDAAAGGRDPGVVDRFLDLEASGWKGRRRSALASTPADEHFFREMCLGFAAEGRLVAYELGGPRGTAAMMISLLGGTGVFDFKIAYDERYADHRPGTVLRFDAARMVSRSSRAWVDSCAAPDNQWAHRVYPDDRPVGHVFTAATGRPGSLACRVAPGWVRYLRPARRRVVAGLERLRRGLRLSRGLSVAGRTVGG